MKIFYDFEFNDDGRTIDPISVGMVREDNQTYYAEFDSFDWSGASMWLHASVSPHLQGGEYLKDKHTIRDEITEFVGVNPSFWSYCGSYDHVCLIQLHGQMINQPAAWPYYNNEITTLYDLLMDKAETIKSIVPKQTTPLHHALNDALWNKLAYEALMDKFNDYKLDNL